MLNLLFYFIWIYNQSIWTWRTLVQYCWRFRLFHHNIRCIIAAEDLKGYLIKNLNFNHLPLTPISGEALGLINITIIEFQKENVKNETKSKRKSLPVSILVVWCHKSPDKHCRFKTTLGWHHISSLETWYVFVYCFGFIFDLAFWPEQTSTVKLQIGFIENLTRASISIRVRSKFRVNFPCRRIRIQINWRIFWVEMNRQTTSGPKYLISIN